MFRKIFLLLFSLVLLFQPSTTQAKEFGVLLSDDDPYLVKTTYGYYKCEWYGGSISFWEGDIVLLTDPDAGFNYMIGIRGPSQGSKAWVYCDDL